MLHGLAFLTLIAVGNIQATAKAPPAPPIPCAHPMLRLAAEQPEVRKRPPAEPRARDKNPPCAILQNWSPAEAGTSPAGAPPAIA